MIRLGISVNVAEKIRPRAFEVIADRGMGNPYRTVFIFHICIRDANLRMHTNATNKYYHRPLLDI